MSWSPQQDAALRRVREWLADKHGPQIFRLFGYAGSGKTTLAREVETIAAWMRKQQSSAANDNTPTHAERVTVIV